MLFSSPIQSLSLVAVLLSLSTQALAASSQLPTQPLPPRRAALKAKSPPPNMRPAPRAPASPAALSKAKRYFAEGVKHYRARRFMEAQAAFAAGYELSHKPGFLWNMAESARELGNRDRALELYQSYLAGSAATSPHRREAAQYVEAWTPPARPLTAAVPPPLGQPSRTMPVAPASSGADEGGSPFYHTWWFWTGTGVVVAAAVVTTVLVVTSSSDDGSSQPVGGYRVDFR